jgi:hypothetical protein
MNLGASGIGELSDTNFTNCKCTRNGGALRINIKCTITSCFFNICKAEGNFYSLFLLVCIFFLGRRDVTNPFGGAIYITNVDITISSCVFFSCNSLYDGGMIKFILFT